MEYQVLGPLRLQRRGESLTLSTRLQQLVAALLAYQTHPIEQDVLAEAIWPKSPQARATLQSYMAKLRDRLGPEDRHQVQRVGGGYCLIPDGPTDLDVFHQHHQAALLSIDDDPASAVTSLRGALALWRGPAFGKRSTDALVRGSASRLDELRLSTEELLCGALLQTGDHKEATLRLTTLCQAHPFRESFWEQRMIALYQDGRQAEALRAYETARTTLRDELGIDPSQRLRDVEAMILSQALPLQTDTLGVPDGSHFDGSLSGLDGAQLPTRISSFFGRGNDVAEVCRWLQSHQLVTLVGPGGVGKTRLALEVAHRFCQTKPAPGFLIDLASISSPDHVPSAFAHALNLDTDGEDIGAQVLAILRTRRLLLVVDNCEHVADAAAALVGEILRSTPTQILATSIEPLYCEGENVYTVPPLSNEATSHDRSPALRLIIDRARAAGITFDEDSDAEQDLISLCERLDGLPLALELAAAQLAFYSPAALEQRLDGRFELLSRMRPDSNERHSSLGKLMTSSWDNLSDEGRRVLERLSLFPADFDLQSAEGIAETGTTTSSLVLSQLRSKSLLLRHDRPAGPRYRLLETTKLFGRRQLAEAGQLAANENRFIDWHVDEFLERGLDSVLLSCADVRWVADNFTSVRAAAQRAIDHRDWRAASILLLAGSGLAHLGFHATLPWLKPMVEVSAIASIAESDSARLLLASALLSIQADPLRTEQHAQQALSLAITLGDDLLIGMACAMCLGYARRPDPQHSQTLLAQGYQAADAARSTKVKHLLDAWGAFNPAIPWIDNRAVIAHYRSINDMDLLQRSRLATGVIGASLVEGEIEVARQANEDINAMEKALGLTSSWFGAIHASLIAAFEDRPDRAAQLLASALDEEHATRGNQRSRPAALITPAVVAHRLGDDKAALELVELARLSASPMVTGAAVAVYRTLRKRLADSDDMSDQLNEGKRAKNANPDQLIRDFIDRYA